MRCGVVHFISSSQLLLIGMTRGGCGHAQCIEDLFCFGDLIRRAMGDYEEFVGFYRRFILKNAVFGDAVTVKTCAQGLRPAIANAPSWPISRGNNQFSVKPLV